MTFRAILMLGSSALLLSSCRTSAEAPAPELPQVQPMSASESTTFELDGQQVTVTSADAETLRAALIARIEAQELEHRDKLLARTRNGSVELSADNVKIGSWYVQVAGNGLEAMVRLGAGSAPAYATRVAKQDGAWRVDPIEAVLIHPAR